MKVCGPVHVAGKTQIKLKCQDDHLKTILKVNPFRLRQCLFKLAPNTHSESERQIRNAELKLTHSAKFVIPKILPHK